MVLEVLNLLRQQMPPMDSRHATNMATLLSAAWVALEGRIASEQEANAWIQQHETLIEYHAEVHEEDDALACLNHLLGSEAKEETIGETIQAALRKPRSHNEFINPNAQLYAYGIRVEGTEAVFVANNHPGLDKIFQGSKWAERSWKTALARLDGAEKPKDPVRFGGSKTRAVKLPARLFPDPDDPETYDPVSGTGRHF